MVRASLLLLATVAGVASFGYVDPGMMGGCTSAMDFYSCIEMTGSGCFFDTVSHMCMDDSCAAYHHDDASCTASSSTATSSSCNYAYDTMAMGLCSADHCFQYNDDYYGATCNGFHDEGYCYWYTTIPGYESGLCAKDVCSVASGTDEATCGATDPGGSGSYCTWDGASCFMM